MFEEIDPNTTVRLFIEEAMLNGMKAKEEIKKDIEHGS
jgi:hypothetical protein